MPKSKPAPTIERLEGVCCLNGAHSLRAIIITQIVYMTLTLIMWIVTGNAFVIGSITKDPYDKVSIYMFGSFWLLLTLIATVYYFG